MIRLEDDGGRQVPIDIYQAHSRKTASSSPIMLIGVIMSSSSLNNFQ